MAGDGDVDSMLPFRLKRVGDRMKRCWKIKRAMLARGEVSSGKGKRGDDVWDDVNLIGSKNEKKIHMIDSTATNGW
jgi:hypothetical protein